MKISPNWPPMPPMYSIAPNSAPSASRKIFKTYQPNSSEKLITIQTHQQHEEITSPRNQRSKQESQEPIEVVL